MVSWNSEIWPGNLTPRARSARSAERRHILDVMDQVRKLGPGLFEAMFLLVGNAEFLEP